VTNNDELAATMRLMRNFGFCDMDKVIHPGTNGKMIEVAAAMGLANLDVVSDMIEANRQNYRTYQEALSGLPGIRLLVPDQAELSNYHYVVMQVGSDCPVSRDAIIRCLHAENVLARRYFWPGCHRMKPYRDLFPHARLLLPNTERVADRVVVLPTGVTMDSLAVQTVASIIRVFTGAHV